MTDDEKFMRQAIVLARRGAGRTHPNPAVGCVIVKNGRVIGRGWHRRAGAPHAEVEALRSLKNPSSARGATAYVTLEPCCTQGRTPPCTRALLDAGITRAVVGAIDPNPRHRGRGIKILRKAGVETESGILEDECTALNPEFNHVMRTGLPWVIAKCGMSLDGRLTRPPGEGQWITSPAARRDAMRLRADVDAVMVGAGTVRADDPALNVRGIPGAKQPLRVVWAPRGLPPRACQLMQAAKKGEAVILRQKSLRNALRDLAKRGVQRILLEGGGRTLGCVFDAGLVRELVFYMAPMLAGGSIPAVAGRGVGSLKNAVALSEINFERVGGCLKISGSIKND